MQRNSILASVVWLAACGGNDSGKTSTKRVDAPPPATPDKGTSTKDTAKASSSKPAAEAVGDPATLTRATAPSSVKAKAANNFGFKLDRLSPLFALTGAPAVPAWAQPTDADPSAIRDDDLDTTWSCPRNGDKSCSIGLSFSEPVTLEALRLYAAAGPDWRDYKGSPRPKVIRVHTDAGYVDAKLADGASHRYVIFAGPVETKSVTVEIMDAYRGNKDETLHVAELDAYGSAGPKRLPLDLDPSYAFVSYETEAWKPKSGGQHTIRQAFVNLARPGAAPQRLVRGTAMFGQKGDRLLLFESLFNTACGRHDGSYFALDQHTRMIYPLGKLGGVPGKVIRHPEGLGFLVEHDDDERNYRALVLGDDGLEIKRAAKRESIDPTEQKAKWGFTDATVLPRGPHPASAPPNGCEPGSDADASAVQAVVAETDATDDPSQWLVCAIDEAHKAVVGPIDPCATRWSIALLGADGAIVDREDGPKKSEARGLRLTRMTGVGLIVEATEKSGARATLHVVTPDAIEPLASGASLAVRPPPACGPCSDVFPGTEPAPAPAPPATEPAAPRPADPEPTDPEPTDPEPPDPEPSDPEPSDDLPSIDDPG